MLSQIVRPMVRTQLRLLASSQSVRPTLTTTIAQWLGFLGVKARVTQLDATQSQIQVSLTVHKPDACDPQDWQQIVQKLSTAGPPSLSPEPSQFTAQQQSTLQRLLAHLLQVGNPEAGDDWDTLYPQLQTLGLDEQTLLGIRSALKVPQSLEQLIDHLDPDLAAIAFPKALSIALLDRQVTPSEDQALASLYQALKRADPG